MKVKVFRMGKKLFRVTVSRQGTPTSKTSWTEPYEITLEARNWREAIQKALWTDRADWLPFSKDRRNRRLEIAVPLENIGPPDSMRMVIPHD